MAQTNVVLNVNYKWLSVVTNGSSVVYSSGYITDANNVARQALIGVYDSNHLIPDANLQTCKFKIGNSGDSWGDIHPSPSSNLTKNRLWIEFPNSELRKLIGIDPAKVVGINLMFLVRSNVTDQSPMCFINPSPLLMFACAPNSSSWDYSGSGARVYMNKLVDNNPFVNGYFSDSNFNLSDIAVYDGSGFQTFFESQMNRASDITGASMWSLSNGYSDYTGNNSIGYGGNGIVYVDPYAMFKTYASENTSSNTGNLNGTSLTSQKNLTFPQSSSNPFNSYMGLTWNTSRTWQNASNTSLDYSITNIFYPLDIRSTTVNFHTGNPSMSALFKHWYDGVNANSSFVHKEGMMFNYEGNMADIYGVAVSLVYDGNIISTLPDGTINFTFSGANPSGLTSTNGSASITATATKSDGSAFSSSAGLYMSAGNANWQVTSLTYSSDRKTATFLMTYIGSASGTPVTSNFTLTGNDTTLTSTTTQNFTGSGTSPTFTISTVNATKPLTIAFSNYSGALVGSVHSNGNCVGTFDFAVTRNDGTAFPSMPSVGISNGVRYFQISNLALSSNSKTVTGNVTYIGPQDSSQHQLTLSATSSSTLPNTTIQNYVGSGVSDLVAVTCTPVLPIQPTPLARYDEYAPVASVGGGGTPTGLQGSISDPNDASSAVAPLSVDCDCNGLPMTSSEATVDGCQIGRDYGVFVDTINGINPQSVMITNRLVPFKDMMPRWMEGSSIEYLYDFLQNYFMTAYQTERDYAFTDSSNNFHQFCNISLFEKINRLRDLEDPIEIEWQFISELAKERGFDFRMFRAEDTSPTDFVEDYSASFKKSIRLFLDNLPRLNHSKGTKKGIRGLLGLLGMYIDLKQRFYSVDYDAPVTALDVSKAPKRDSSVAICDQTIWSEASQVYDNSKVKVYATPNIYDFRDEIDMTVDTPELNIGSVGTSLVGVNASNGELDINLNFQRISASPIYDVDLGITEENLADFPQRIIMGLSNMDKVRPVNAVFAYDDVGVDLGTIAEVVMQDDFNLILEDLQDNANGGLQIGFTYPETGIKTATSGDIFGSDGSYFTHPISPVLADTTLNNAQIRVQTQGFLRYSDLVTKYQNIVVDFNANNFRDFAYNGSWLSGLDASHSMASWLTSGQGTGYIWLVVRVYDTTISSTVPIEKWLICTSNTTYAPNSNTKTIAQVNASSNYIEIVGDTTTLTSFSNLSAGQVPLCYVPTVNSYVSTHGITSHTYTTTAKNSIEELSAQDLRSWMRDSNGDFTIPLNSTSVAGDLTDYSD